MTNKRLTLCVVTALIATGLSAPPAQAAFTVTLQQLGPDVVASGSGTINTSDLRPVQTIGPKSVTISPLVAFLILGPDALQFYYGGMTGPRSFGTRDDVIPGSASTAVGDTVGIEGLDGLLYLPVHYVSGSPLMDTSTWPDNSLSSLGVTPGTYVWTWGSGANADSFTLDAGVTTSAAPEPATLALFGLGLVGVALFRRRLAR